VRGIHQQTHIGASLSGNYCPLHWPGLILQRQFAGLPDRPLDAVVDAIGQRRGF
jgi:hypothetical protein